MNSDLISSLHNSFEGAAKIENGVTYWLARDIQPLLDYSRWENFETAIDRAKTACATSEHPVDNHFREVTKMVDIGSGTSREIKDLMLTRYACYLIAQNGDPAALEKVISENDITAASKADRIASATKKTITENMDVDPALYKAFSKMLEETIQAYRQKRISETEYLMKVKDIANDVAKGKRDDVPEIIANNQDAQAFYGIILPVVFEKNGKGENGQHLAAQIAMDVLQIICSPNHFIVHLWQNLDAQKKLQNAIDDYFFDVVSPNFGLNLDPKELDEIEHALMNVARARFPL